MLPHSSNIKDDTFGKDHGLSIPNTFSNSNPFMAGILDSSYNGGIIPPQIRKVIDTIILYRPTSYLYVI